MTHRAICALVTLTTALLAASLPRPAAAADARAAITAAYHNFDTAFARNDLVAVYASYAPSWVLIDQTGKSHSLAEARTRTKYLWRRPDGERAMLWHSATDVESIAVEGDYAVARGRVDIELAMLSTMGTAVDGHDVTTFEDQWTLTPSGWRITRGRVIAFERHGQAQPSQQVLNQLAQMRESGRQMQDFNNANNYSQCMNSSGMQKYGYQERQTYCQPH